MFDYNEQTKWRKAEEEVTNLSQTAELLTEGAKAGKTFEQVLTEQMLKHLGSRIPDKYRVELVRVHNEPGHVAVINVKMVLHGSNFQLETRVFSPRELVNDTYALNFEELRQPLDDLIAQAEDSERLANLVWP